MAVDVRKTDPNLPKPKAQSFWRRRIVLLGALTLVACCGFLVFSINQGGQLADATRTAEAGTQVVQRSWTATPSPTPAPTATATATLTPTGTAVPTETLPPLTGTALGRSAGATGTAAARLAVSAVTGTAKAAGAAGTTAAQVAATVQKATAAAGSAGASLWITYGNRQVGVTKAEWDTSLGYFRAESGKVLLSLYIVAKNNGADEISFNPLDFNVADGGGQVNGKIYGPEKEPVFEDCTIQQSGACEGWWTTQVFDRPNVRAKLTLRWSPGLFDQDQETGITPP